MLTCHYPLKCCLYSCVQVIVNDVHIRYEDSDADPAHPIAVGIMLENISVQSTDENWVRSKYGRTVPSYVVTP